jgi:aminoglycoside phosphotransferase family enzyme
MIDTIVADEDKIRALRSVATYPEHPAAVETIETHFAWVYLVGDRAYKLKKAVNLPGHGPANAGGAS